MTPIRIVIADDHPIFREGLRKVIESDPGLEVVGDAKDGEAAIALITVLRPAVAVLDLDMPLKDGFAVLRDLQAARCPVKVIFLTMHNSEAIFQSALDLGVDGYVLKDGAITEITSAIRTVAEGRNHISPALSTHLLNRKSRANDLAQRQPAIKNLTPTERRVLKLVADEKTSREIAAALFISVRTVDHHRAHICEKLELRGFNALVRFAISHKSELE